MLILLSFGGVSPRAHALAAVNGQCPDHYQPSPTDPTVCDYRLDSVTIHGGQTSGGGGWPDYLFVNNGRPGGSVIDLGAMGGPFVGNPGAQDPAADSSKKGCPKANPIYPATGNKIEEERDFATTGEQPLGLTRSYNHYWQGVGLFGKHWLSDFDYKLTFGTTAINACYPRPNGGSCTIGSNTVIYAWRPDGRIIKFIRAADGTFYEDKPSPIAKIVWTGSSYNLTNELGGSESYTPSGYVTSVSERPGLTWSYTYDAGWTYPTRITHINNRFIDLLWTNGQLTGVRDPAGNVYTYTYATNAFGAGLHRLASATSPGNPATTTTYHYEDAAHPDQFTGKSVNGVRYSKFTYDAAGHATSSEHNGIERYTFQYTPGANGLLTVVETNPLGKQTVYTFENGKPRTTTGQPSTYCPATSYSETIYDANGYLKSKTDFRGSVTTYTYNAQGQLQEKTEASGTPSARTTRFSWDPTPGKNRMLSQTVVGLMSTSFEYGKFDRIARVTTTNLSAAGVQGQARSTTYDYKYWPIGNDWYGYFDGPTAEEAVDGPIAGAGDKTTRAYDLVGNLTSVASSTGIETYSDFTGLGQPRKIVTPNGAVTEVTYDERDRPRLIREYVNGVAQDTAYTYDAAGRATTIRTPNGRVLTRDYDQAWRVVREYSQEAAGTYEVATYAYNANSQVTSKVVERKAAVVAPAGAPSLAAPTSSPDGAFALSWSAIATAAAYQLDESVNGGGWASLGRYTGVGTTLSGRADGSYTYRVSACNEYGCASASNAVTVQVLHPPATAPALSAPGTSSSSTYTITWTAVMSSTSYKVEENTGNGLWTALAPTASTSMTLTGRGIGTYSYRVSACNLSGCGPVSDVGSVSRIDLPGAPTISAPSVNATGSYTISWSSSTGATAYQLDESVNGGGWTAVAGGNSAYLTGRSTAATYGYRVWACNAAGCGTPSATVFVQPISYGSSYINQSVPTLVAAGTPFAVSVQLSNTGNTTWTAADAYSLGSSNPGDNTTWGVSRIGTPGAVVPGGGATFAFNATAPSTAGTYNFQWRMVRDGYTWFGASTPNVVITVASGTIAASTSPCKLYVGDTTCAVTMSWNSSRADAEVWVSNPDGTNPQLFARAQSGSQVASWIATNTVRFALKSGGVVLATKDVYAYQSGEQRPAPPPPKCPTRQCQVP
ncbi:DUF6531 domain-containing protein [Lysobacter sp. HA35]